MTCAKRIVRCTLFRELTDPVFTGENACGNPQPACPRDEGEGYEKCQTVCQQEAHAEIMAIRAATKADVDLRGWTALITGIDHLCKPCARALSEEGVEEIILRRQL